MNKDLATHISLLAAPIYAAFLIDMVAEMQVPVRKFPSEAIDALRQLAIEHAYGLWLETLKRP